METNEKSYCDINGPCGQCDRYNECSGESESILETSADTEAKQEVDKIINSLENQKRTLQERIDYLRKLSENPPKLPAGYKVAEIEDVDTASSKYNDEAPEIGSKVVVSETCSDKVYAFVSSDGLAIVDKREKGLWPISIVENPEVASTVLEAIDAFLKTRTQTK